MSSSITSVSGFPEMINSSSVIGVIMTSTVELLEPPQAVASIVSIKRAHIFSTVIYL